MAFPVEDKQGFAVITLKGEVDLKNSPDARKVILNSLKRRKPVLVDLSCVQYIDSSGVASLVEGLQYARSNDLGFSLVGVSEPALNVLRLARLDQVFRIHASLEDGLHSGD
jgi:anti-sigma B factor antagonist